MIRRHVYSCGGSVPDPVGLVHTRSPIARSVACARDVCVNPSPRGGTRPSASTSTDVRVTSCHRHTSSRQGECYRRTACTRQRSTDDPHRTGVPSCHDPRPVVGCAGCLSCDRRGCRRRVLAARATTRTYEPRVCGRLSEHRGTGDAGRPLLLRLRRQGSRRPLLGRERPEHDRGPSGRPANQHRVRTHVHDHKSFGRTPTLSRDGRQPRRDRRERATRAIFGQPAGLSDRKRALTTLRAGPRQQRSLDSLS